MVSQAYQPSCRAAVTSHHSDTAFIVCRFRSGAWCSLIAGNDRVDLKQFLLDRKGASVVLGRQVLAILQSRCSQTRAISLLVPAGAPSVCVPSSTGPYTGSSKVRCLVLRRGI